MRSAGAQRGWGVGWDPRDSELCLYFSLGWWVRVFVSLCGGVGLCVLVCVGRGPVCTSVPGNPQGPVAPGLAVCWHMTLPV